MYKTLHDEKYFLSKSLNKKGIKCYFFGPGYKFCNNLSLEHFLKKKKLKISNIDLVLFFLPERIYFDGLSKYEQEYYDVENKYYFNQFKNIHGIPKVFWINDFWHNNIYEWEIFIRKFSITDILSIYTPFHTKKKIHNKYFSNSINVNFHKYFRSINPSDFIKKKNKSIDVLMLGAMSGFYPNRQFFLDNLSKIKNFNFTYKKHPGYLFKKDIKSKSTVGRNYFKLLSKSKIFITCSTKFNIPIAKVWEIMASGNLLMIDKINNSKLIKLKSNTNYVEVSKNNYLEKIKYYLKNVRQREKIISNGRKLALKEYNNYKISEYHADKLIKIKKNFKINKYNTEENKFYILILKFKSIVLKICQLVQKIVNKIFKILRSVT